MYIFNAISLLGGLAMFLYGMRLMSSTLKESSSGTLKKAMEKVTNNPVKAFLLGILITAIIQSSTATIVITSGLVAAGLISLDQSLGLIIGANVGTTVTGQIIRLLDVEAGASTVLRFFQPSTLAPVALIIGIVLIMFFKFKKSDIIGNIAIGFGILFSGLMNMTAAVSSLTETGIVEKLFTGLGNNPFLAYLTGAGVAFVLQSSSATIGILQAFSLSSDIPFSVIYIVITGIYLGDCVTTGIVCSVGAKADAKRVGIVNILFNLSETVVVLIAVTLLNRFGVLDSLWGASMSPGQIANTNTIFNMGCALLLLPLVGVYGKLSRRIIRDDKTEVSKYTDQMEALNPVFFSTPALAFKSCYNLLNTMLNVSTESINKAIDVIAEFDADKVKQIEEEEDSIDKLTDAVNDYLVRLSAHVFEDYHIRILDQYNKVAVEVERLSDHAMNIAEIAREMREAGISFSPVAIGELEVMRELLNRIFDDTKYAFEKRDEAAARNIEPLEQVIDDMCEVVHNGHIERLREGHCTVHAGTRFLDILTNIERISDVCSNIGVATVVRINPDSGNLAHSYITSLHKGGDPMFNKVYNSVHDEYLGKLSTFIPAEGPQGK